MVCAGYVPARNNEIIGAILGDGVGSGKFNNLNI